MSARFLPTGLALLALGIIPVVACGQLRPPYGVQNNDNNKKAEAPPQVFKFVASGQGMVGGRRHVLVQVTTIDGARTFRLAVPNVDQNSNDPSPEIASLIETLKPGDVVKVQVEPQYGTTMIKKIDPAKVKPGEQDPRGYVFVDTNTDPSGGVTTGVVLSKYGQEVQLALPRVRGEKGKLEPDPQLLSQIQQIKTGDVVLIELQGRSPVLQAIYPYTEPKSGKLTKVSSEEVEGQKAPAAEIESSDGKTVTALVPGKLVNKRWVPDSNVLRQVRVLRPGTPIEFRTHDQDGKTYLVDIAKAPPAPKPTPPREGRS